MEKYGTFGQAADNNIIRIPETTNTLSEYAILIAFPLQQGFTRTRLKFIFACTLRILYISVMLPVFDSVRLTLTEVYSKEINRPTTRAEGTLSGELGGAHRCHK